MKSDENPDSGLTPLEPDDSAQTGRKLAWLDDPRGHEPLPADDSAQIKRKLAWRMGIASLMIVFLLGGLALFDYLAARPDETEPEPEPPRFTEPVPVAGDSGTRALGPIVPAPPEDGKEEQDSGVPEETTAPADPVAVDTTPPPPSPEAAANTAAPVAPRPARPTSAPSPAGRSGQKSGPAGTAPPRHAQTRPDTPETGTKPAPAPSPPPAGQPEQKEPPARTVPPRPDTPATTAKSAPPRILSRLLSGYTLQAGVFTDPRRAEDVHAKLVQEGIPATLETRVLVGPFKNRTEVESARAKMRAMGIDALPVQRSGKK
jgi:DedD protein